MQFPTHIVLIIHGFASNPQRYEKVKAAVEDNLPGARILIPKLPISLFSAIHPNKVVISLLAEIDKVWEECMLQKKPDQKMPSIIIIGHSAGSLLARKLYIVACGENHRCRFEDPGLDKNGRPWADHVERLVLLAGINRGWSLNGYLYGFKAIQISVLTWLGGLFSTIRTPFIFYMRSHSSFVSNLRLQWIWMTKTAESEKKGSAMTIQLLGTVDDIVPPANNIDYFSSNNFIFLEVPYSGHVSVLDIDHTDAGKERAVVFRQALLETKAELEKIQFTQMGQMTQPLDDKVTDVAFVIHGIRDTAYWTRRMANRIRSEGTASGRKVATETSSYGYFSMLHFMLPYHRQRKMEWLVDQYIENLWLYPNASDNFSFFGHSNGTYLLAAAMKKYPAIVFRNVVLAGSVVHKNYDWDELLNSGRIKNYLNLVATRDWVVGIFPKAFEKLNIQDLGAGGFDGFIRMQQNQQLKYINGTHGEGTSEKYWNEIAYFIIHGTMTPTPKAFVPSLRPNSMKVLGRVAPFPFLLTLILIVGIFALILTFFKVHPLTTVALACIYISLVWTAITKF